MSQIKPKKLINCNFTNFHKYLHRLFFLLKKNIIDHLSKNHDLVSYLVIKNPDFIWNPKLVLHFVLLQIIVTS